MIRRGTATQSLQAGSTSTRTESIRGLYADRTTVRSWVRDAVTTARGI